MKSIPVLIFVVFAFLFQASWASPVQNEKVYPFAIIGGGPAGLSIAYNRLKSGEPFILFTSGLGGPVVNGGLPETWKGRLSWKLHPRQKSIAESVACSTTSQDESTMKKEILCFVKGMIKILGPEHIKSQYELVEVKTSHNPDAPLELIFHVAGSPHLKTIYAQNVEFAIPPAALQKLKFTKTK